MRSSPAPRELRGGPGFVSTVNRRLRWKSTAPPLASPTESASWKQCWSISIKQAFLERVSLWGSLDKVCTPTQKPWSASPPAPPPAQLALSILPPNPAPSTMPCTFWDEHTLSPTGKASLWPFLLCTGPSPFFSTWRAPPRRPGLSLELCSWPDLLPPPGLHRPGAFLVAALSSPSALAAPSFFCGRQLRSLCCDARRLVPAPATAPSTKQAFPLRWPFPYLPFPSGGSRHRTWDLAAAHSNCHGYDSIW